MCCVWLPEALILGMLHKQRNSAQILQHILCMATRGIGAAATTVTMATLVFFLLIFFAQKQKLRMLCLFFFFVGTKTDSLITRLLFTKWGPKNVSLLLSLCPRPSMPLCPYFCPLPSVRVPPFLSFYP